MNDLETYFESVPDFRRAEGRRYPLSKLLVALTLGVMSGYQGYRELSRFIQHNREELSRYIDWSRQATPSHETLRTILSNVDFNKVNQAFTNWVSSHPTMKAHDWLAIDGKALRSTMTQYTEETQNFINMVSAFNHRLGCVVAQHPFANKEESEIHVVRSLIGTLNKQGFILTLDAMHCQKNGGMADS